MRLCGLVLPIPRCCGVAGEAYAPVQGPVFVREPPALLQFLNSTGAVVDCWASGQPPPAIAWLDSSGHEVLHVPSLR